MELYLSIMHQFNNEYFEGYKFDNIKGKQMNKIKLLSLGFVLNQTHRLQSQLLIGKDVADFIIEDGILKHWESGKDGFNFYPCDLEYEIVYQKKDLLSTTKKI